MEPDAPLESKKIADTGVSQRICGSLLIWPTNLQPDEFVRMVEEYFPRGNPVRLMLN